MIMTKCCKTKECFKPTVALGFCDSCYRRFKKHGTADIVQIKSLPGEKWADIASCKNWRISTHGRVKSCRRKTETLVKVQRGKADGLHECLYFRDRAAKGRTFRVHLEVLKAFRLNPHNDTRGVFLDGDNFNCRLENLQWFGKEYLLPLAIQRAKQSSSRWRDNFLDFWDGDRHALDDFFAEMRARVFGFLTLKTTMQGNLWCDVENLVSETLLRTFMAIKRGQIQSINTVSSFCISCARTVLAGSFRNKIFTVNLEQENSGDGGCFSLADVVGFYHPSAELVAIGREGVSAGRLIAF